MHARCCYTTTGATLVAAFVALCGAAPAAAEEGAVDVSAAYRVDAMGAIANAPSDVAVLDDLHVTASADLERAFDWRGASAFVHILNNSGDAPNDTIGTLQGVDNIEVGRQRVRLYEIWLEQALAGGSVRAGLYDLNSEFYSTEASALLMAPAFGIGSEIAATGPNGPSIFPSTALSVRVAAHLSAHSVFKFAVVNSNAGVVGDPDGVDTTFDHGALLISQIDWTGAG